MPVTVVVRCDARANQGSGGSESNAPSLTFDGARIVIGRSDGSDVRLPDPSVSLRHASIRAQGAEYVIVDEGSTNGTWVGGVKLGAQTPRLVKSGDLVRLGRVWLELIVGQKPATPDLGLATRDLALVLVRNAMDAVGDDTRAMLRVVEGPDLGAELRLVEEGRAYLLGRGTNCDLPLADEDASREHAAVVRRGSQVLLRDLGSRNGVFIGDTRLTPDRDAVWRHTTMARIGMSVLALKEPVSLALAELEAAADEKLLDADAPLPPPSIVNPPPPSNAAPATGSALPESRHDPGQQAPIAEVQRDLPSGSRTAPTVPRAKPRGLRTWTAADVIVVTIAVLVIGASVACLVWVLR
jgi:pSer/pThr/pTyr-binding forkhead associated (FHA) protein